MYNLRARSYQPSAGRFLSRDTYPVDLVNPRELNRYGYVAGDPINGYDPLGLMALVGTATLHKQVSLQAISDATALGLTTACVFRQTATFFQAMMQIVQNGGTLRATGLCDVERQEKKTCNSPEYANYVRCSAIRSSYSIVGDVDTALNLARILVNNPTADKFNRKPSKEGPCAGKGGTHWEVRAYDGRGKYYTSIGECPCCDDSSGTPTIIKRCGFFGSHDPIFRDFHQ